MKTKEQYKDSKMAINWNERIVPVDVDQTLIHRNFKDFPTSRWITADYYGIPKTIVPHRENIDLLKAYKARGFFVRVHTNNGVQWALEVIDKLELEGWVDSVETKSDRHMDDSTNPVEIIGPRVFIEEDNE